eukprot:g7820.t1
MQNSQGLNSSLKAALLSKRQGSFIFPEDVVVEEVLDHLDNIWNALWEGQPKNIRNSEEFSNDVTPDDVVGHVPSSEKKSIWYTVRRALRLTKESKEDECILEERIENWSSMIPRMPSGMDWYNEIKEENS